ncbi:MAG: hypothetical protein P1U85_13090 [Verrucomicrobiales bacterium]|nr:hypothetical protein [Verrucomicrobiales bacterium]
MRTIILQTASKGDYNILPNLERRSGPRLGNSIDPSQSLDCVRKAMEILRGAKTLAAL